MSDGRGYIEWSPRRPFVPDLVTVAVLFLLLFVPTTRLAIERDARTVPWLAFGAAVGVLLVWLDARLLPRETRVRWNAWGLAVIDGSGGVTRAHAWRSITSFRVDRCTSAPADRELVLVLGTGGHELVWSQEHRVGDLVVPRWVIDRLTTFLRERGVPEEPSQSRAQRPRASWSLRSLSVALLWLAGAVVLTNALSPTVPGPLALLLGLPFAVWLAHRVEPFLRTLRVALAGRGMRVAKVRAVRSDALVVVAEGGELVVECEVADGREGSSPEAVALGPLSWPSSASVLVSHDTRGGTYRDSTRERRARVVSVRERARARRVVMAALVALGFLAPSAVPIPWTHSFVAVVTSSTLR
jgi:hypothetical protein